MATEEAFRAAVNIIRSMPKDGKLLFLFLRLLLNYTEGLCVCPDSPTAANSVVCNEVKRCLKVSTRTEVVIGFTNCFMILCQ